MVQIRCISTRLYVSGMVRTSVGSEWERVCVCDADRGRVRSSETDWELIGVEACDMDSLGKHV